MGVFAKARIEAIMKGAGAERVSAKSIVRMDELVADFGKNVSKTAIDFAKAAGRKTVQGDDIKIAVSKVGVPKSSPTGPKSKAFAKARVERVIRDAGAERVSGDAVEYLNKQLEAYCYTLGKSAVDIARHAKRKTIKDTDIMP
ncbi:MAG: histone [Candidatus Hodarchaeales archaeon]|jgi:histone H3/H4